jgi:hypothetical protein
VQCCASRLLLSAVVADSFLASWCSLQCRLPAPLTPLCCCLQVLRSGFTERGLGSVQDEATGLVVQMLDPQPGELLLDACAAPGGKALYAASRMAGKVRA